MSDTQATWTGGFKAVGRMLDQALTFWQDVQDCETFQEAVDNPS